MIQVPISLLVAAFLMQVPASHAQSLDKSPVAFRSGNWKVVRSVDVMTDKVSCTGIYKDRYGVQLVGHAMYVSVRGGIQGIVLRFGDSPPRPMRLPEKMEKDVSAVMLEGNDFAEVIRSNRLRLEVVTLVRRIETEDFDITGVQAALESIRSGCPLRAESDSTQRGPATNDSLCAESLVSRMKATGITDAQIAAACKKVGE